MSDERVLLLDTNVWLSNYLPSRPNHDLAKELVANALAKNVTLLYPIHSANDIFYIVASDMKKLYRMENDGEMNSRVASAANAAAWGCINNLGEVALAVGADLSDVWVAQKQRRLHSDFEDDMVIAAAVRSKADLLVTEDKKLAANAPVATADVAKALEWLETL